MAFSLLLAAPALAQDKPFLAESCRAGVTVECLFDEAAVLAQRLPSAGERSNRLWGIAFSQVTAGRKVHARQVMALAAAEGRQIENQRSRPYFALRIAELYLRLDDTAAARDTLRIEFRSARALIDVEARFSALRFVAGEQAKFGDFEGARATAAEARSAAESIVDPNRRSIVLESLAEISLLIDGPAEAVRIRDPFRRAVALAIAARYLARRDKEAADKLESAALAQAERFAPPSADFQRTVIISGIASNRVMVRDFASARRLIDLISEESHLRLGTDGAIMLAVSMVEAGVVPRALAVADRLTAGDTFRIYAAISSRLLQDGDFEGALRMAERVAPRHRVRLLCDIARAQKAQPGAHVSVLVKAEAAANDEPLARFRNLALVALTYVEVGDQSRARSLIDRYLDESRKFHDLNVWVRPLLAVKDRDAALRVALELYEEAKRDEAKRGPMPSLRREFGVAAQELALAGNLVAAREASLSIDSDDLKASSLAGAAANFLEGALLRQ